MHASASVSPDEGEVDRNPAPVKVLIVDDDATFRVLCRALLNDSAATSYIVEEAGTAAEAMDAFAAHAFDCVLLDYRMPETSGTELMERLRKVGADTPPFIILTAVGSEDVAMEAMHAGAADYIPKHQANPGSLNRAISNCVEKSRLRRSVEERTRVLIEMTQELEKKNFELRRFYHMISHEIKTPLSASREFASLVADGVMGEINEQQKSALTYVIEGCDQIARHFNELIEVARSDTGKMSMKMARISVESILDRCVSGVLPAVSQKRITLERLDIEELPDIYVDAFRIAQVLSNLLSNAIEHTPDRGRINVSAERSDDRHVCIIVQDFGRGIDAEDLPHIFDRLFQANTEAHTAHGGQGLGLGLSIAREIVEMHGGRVEVESEVGVGSTFYVYLPIDSPETEAASLRSATVT